MQSALTSMFKKHRTDNNALCCIMHSSPRLGSQGKSPLRAIPFPATRRTVASTSPVPPQSRVWRKALVLVSWPASRLLAASAVARGRILLDQVALGEVAPVLEPFKVVLDQLVRHRTGVLRHAAECRSRRCPRMRESEIKGCAEMRPCPENWLHDSMHASRAVPPPWPTAPLTRQLHAGHHASMFAAVPWLLVSCRCRFQISRAGTIPLGSRCSPGRRRCSRMRRWTTAGHWCPLVHGRTAASCRVGNRKPTFAAANSCYSTVDAQDRTGIWTG